MDKLKMVSLLSAETVVFSYNPEKLLVKRQTRAFRGQPSGDFGGNLGLMFQGTGPLTIKVAKAILDGGETKPMGDLLLGWLQPGGGLAGKLVGAAMGGSHSSLAKEPPTLLLQWGPPAAAFSLEVKLKTVAITYNRFDEVGIPMRADVMFEAVEQPSFLSLLNTNPTSGGKAGRRHHVVIGSESLANIAMEKYGNPGLWRRLAELNNIDDPQSVRAGDVLFLPAPDEMGRDVAR